MCRRVQCEVCGKPSFAGCGMHVEQVLGNVPTAERCRCREQVGEPRQQAGGAPKQPSWLKQLLGGKP